MIIQRISQQESHSSNEHHQRINIDQPTPRDEEQMSNLYKEYKELFHKLKQEHVDGKDETQVKSIPFYTKYIHDRKVLFVDVKTTLLPNESLFLYTRYV